MLQNQFSILAADLLLLFKLHGQVAVAGIENHLSFLPPENGGRVLNPDIFPVPPFNPVCKFPLVLAAGGKVG